MPDAPKFSEKLLKHPEAQNPGALDRIALAKRRIQSILDRETVAHPRTLEQKIAEQGPKNQRVDPHLIHLATMDLRELGRLRTATHPSTAKRPWYANPGVSEEVLQPRLAELAPLYDQISGHGFGNHIGDALEVVIYKCLQRIENAKPRHSFLGTFDLAAPKDQQGRYRKVQPPKSFNTYRTDKEADFVLFGHDSGPLCIECKNYREWIYPREQAIKDLIIKSCELNMMPLLIARRLHYTARTNLLEPAGIIAHETYFQYYPADQAHLAARAQHKRSLGFTDVVATEEPHPRTVKFFADFLPRLAEPMSSKWRRNRDALWEFAHDQINLAQLYNAIGSPASGNWQEPEDETFEPE